MKLHVHHYQAQLNKRSINKPPRSTTHQMKHIQTASMKHTPLSSTTQQTKRINKQTSSTPHQMRHMQTSSLSKPHYMKNTDTPLSSMSANEAHTDTTIKHTHTHTTKHSSPNASCRSSMKSPWRPDSRWRTWRNADTRPGTLWHGISCTGEQTFPQT